MIKIGTSGFSYKDWRGPFYPERLPDKEMLSFYLQHFSAVEINFTYYRLPGPKVMASMARQVEGRGEFAVKAFGGITHERKFPPDLAILDGFLYSIRPLKEAGVLSCVLLQFPYAFKCTPQNLDYLLAIREGLKDTPSVVEFRHKSWVVPEVLATLQQHNLGYCCVDEPSLPNLPPPLVTATSSLGYVRFHGRNRAAWWNSREPWERYNYLYRQDELREWVPKIKELAEQTKKTLIFFNNHPFGQATRNAKDLLRLLVSSE